MAEGCYACDLSAGRTPLPGGRIHALGGWLIEHCTGPLPVGTLIVKPERHLTSVADLDGRESLLLGPLLREATAVVRELTTADQVYVCLWSHAGWQPGHIHFVVQPAWASQAEQHARPGPALQVDLFDRGKLPDVTAVEAFAGRARAVFAKLPTLDEAD